MAQKRMSCFGHLHEDNRTIYPHASTMQRATLYNYFRNYDPATGRYVQSDPIGLRGAINTYSYALENPVTYLDPDGIPRIADR